MLKRFMVQADSIIVEAEDEESAVYEYKKHVLLNDISVNAEQEVKKCLAESEKRKNKCKYCVQPDGCTAPHSVRCQRCLSF
jgi:hypothetical protein